MKRKTIRPEGFELGALCEEAQADGVPCPDMGRDCETCERALAQLKLRHDDQAVLGEEDEDESSA
jgi:hypothetical protein